MIIMASQIVFRDFGFRRDVLSNILFLFLGHGRKQQKHQYLPNSTEKMLLVTATDS
jgi:hypothetical protein